MQTRIAITLLFALSCQAVPQSPARALLDADRAFAAATRERRLEGWLEAFDEHGSQVDDEFRPITGREAVRANMQGFFADPANELEWTPDDARVSEGGNLGATTGRFRMSRRRADGSTEVVLTGRYFDVWRRLPDGTWKLVYDVGDADPEP